MKKENPQGEEQQNDVEYTEYLYFAYKKAKHFVTKETSFVEHTDILLFEQDLDGNIQRLAEMLKQSEELKDRIGKMQGELYFTPKSFGPKGEPRLRPKVSFPFEYQVLWAAVILIIGEWFDTNPKVKNTYSMHDETIREKFDWMVSWSYNGRLNRIKKSSSSIVEDNDFNDSYIHYNSVRLYESHQLALRKLEKHRTQTINEMLNRHEKVYQGELDIKEFFPTLCKGKIKEALYGRLNDLEDVKEFRVKEIRKVIESLFKLKIDYPDINKFNKTNDGFSRILLEYQKDIKNIYESKSQENEEKDAETSKEKSEEKLPKLAELVNILDKTLPLDLIASNFLANCTLNYYIDREIEKQFESEYKNREISVMRYTDDYTVLSTDEKLVGAVIDFIKEKLDTINLKTSVMKTLLTNKKEIIKGLKDTAINKELSDKMIECIEKEVPEDIVESEKEIYIKEKNLLEALGLNIKPTEITRKNKNDSYFIKNLSTTADTKLQALSDEELQLFMQEILGYLKVDNNLGEIKEETVKIFAAWRLNASFREKSYRTRYDQDEINDFLYLIESAIRKYPYKMGFYDVYLLTIFNLIENEDQGYKELKRFLRNIPGYLKDLPGGGTIYQTYFSSIREKILITIAKNWYRFNEGKRKHIRIMLEQLFIKWYANPEIQWTEQYTLYWTLSILRIKLPIHICHNTKSGIPSYLKLLNRIYKKYIFVVSNNENEEKEIDNQTVYVLLRIFSEGLYWDDIKGEYEFNEADILLFDKIEKQILLSPDLHNWLVFARLTGSRMKKKHFKKLDEVDKNQKREMHFEVLDYLQGFIKRYFENPDRYQEIYEWIKPTDNQRSSADSSDQSQGSSFYKKYVVERFKAYAKIRSYYALGDINLQRLPALEVTANDEVSVADWIFYCEMLPYHLESIPSKHDVLHPLTEYEYVKILKGIIKKEEKLDIEIELCKGILFAIQLSFNEWERIRKDKKDKKKEENQKDRKDENEKGSKGVEVTKNSIEYVRCLFAMLTNRPHHIHIKHDFSMYKWNDLQSYFKMTHYPSTKVASLFVNHLNIHQTFYQKVYKLPLEELPYRDMYTSTNTDHNIQQWITEYLKPIEKELIWKKYNRQLELLEIDIDQLRG